MECYVYVDFSIISLVVNLCAHLLLQILVILIYVRCECKPVNGIEDIGKEVGKMLTC